MIVVYIFGSSFTTSVFLTEFADFLESTILCADQLNQLLITSDFNFHVGVIDNIIPMHADFTNLLTGLGLTNMSEYPPTLVATPLILSLPEILISGLFLLRQQTIYSPIIYLSLLMSK